MLRSSPGKHSYLLLLGAALLVVLSVFLYPRLVTEKGARTGAEEGALALSREREAVTGIDVYFPKQNVLIHAEVAADLHSWQKGLMFREYLPEDSGMLFIYPNELPRSFWMKNTFIPLDIIFISYSGNGEKRIVDIKKNLEPCPLNLSDCPPYHSRAESMFVLEVNAGVVDKKRIAVGDSVSF
jgi:uncharacterized protein